MMKSHSYVYTVLHNKYTASWWKKYFHVPVLVTDCNGDFSGKHINVASWFHFLNIHFIEDTK